MITRSSIAFEDFLGSSIAPQVMPPWMVPIACKLSVLALLVHFDQLLVLVRELGLVPERSDRPTAIPYCFKKVFFTLYLSSD